MKGHVKPAFLLGAGLLFVAISVTDGGERPPAGSKPLSSILKSVEERNGGVISSAEFDDGRWKVKVCQNKACDKLYIDPKSGKEARKRKTDSEDDLPPAQSQPLSAIVKSIEERKLGVITEIEFDDGSWEIELRQDGKKTKLRIDPRTGEVKR